MFVSTISDGIDGSESTESDSTTETDEPEELKDSVPSVLCVRQLTIDTIAGIVRDWTYLSAGLPGPWTGHGGALLRKKLDELGIPKVSFAHQDIYGKHEEPNTSAEQSCKLFGRAASPDWINGDGLELALKANTPTVSDHTLWKSRKRRRTNEAVHEGRRLLPGTHGSVWTERTSRSSWVDRTIAAFKPAASCGVFSTSSQACGSTSIERFNQ